MPCYSPKKAYFSRTPNENNKFTLTFSAKKCNKELSPIQIPCRKCIGCRIDYSLSWATRMVLESKSHQENCFITLTYNNENLPKNMSLIKKDVQLFIKRLRKTLNSKKILYYGVGEYGENTKRPHYHLCIFGHNFTDTDDTPVAKNSHAGTKVYKSKSLEKIWGKGHTSVGEFNEKTAAYCARYVTKKIYGELAKDHYGDRIPEFSIMSLKPAIGKNHFTSHYPENGRLYLNDTYLPMPRYLNELQKKINPFYAHNKLAFLTSPQYKKLETKTLADLQREKQYFLAIAKEALKRTKL